METETFRMLTAFTYQEPDIFPLRDSVFEDTPVKIPFQYAWLLEEEYTKESLTRTEYERSVSPRSLFPFHKIHPRHNN